MRRLCAVLLLCAVAAPTAKAQEFAALTGKLVPGRCHMDYCTWLSIENADFVGEAPHGALYRLETKWFSSHHPRGYDRPAPRKLDANDTSYVFCSKTKPALFNANEDKATWRVSFLAPGVKDQVYGANETALALYWAACHRAIVKDVYDGGEKLGRKLGYRIAKAGDDIEKLADPKAALSW